MLQKGKTVAKAKEKTDEEKYGKVLEEITVAEDAFRPVRVSIIEQNDKLWLDIRGMYKTKDGSLRYGKGIRLEIDNGVAEESLLAATQLFMMIEFEDEN
jgi:hypothetical protein